MLNLIQIMKSLLCLGAAIALLRSAAALINKDSHPDQEPILENHAAQPSSSASLAALSTEYIEVTIAQAADPFTASSHDAILADTTPLYTSSPSDPQADLLTQPITTIDPDTTPLWAITYIPYTPSLTCKTASTIAADVASIATKGFPSIRLYATDCSALKHAGPAATTHNINLILGVHIDDPSLESAQSQIDDIIAWADDQWEMVEMVVIGNEAIFNDYTTPSALATFLISAREQLREAGYTGPVTTTEPINVLYENSDILCPAIDIAAANVHPFFHRGVSAETAGSYVAHQLGILASICPEELELEAVNLESGWPRAGRTNGVAVPGVREQRVAIEGILKRSQGRSVVMGFGDDAWKDEGEFGVEGSWGCEGLFEG